MSVEIKVPPVGESIRDVVIGEWKKAHGDFIQVDEVLCEVESEKTNFEMRAEIAGILTIHVESGTKVAVGSVIGVLEEASSRGQGQAQRPSQAGESIVGTHKSEFREGSSVYASPSASKILKEHAIPPHSVHGTGKDSRITKEDALKISSAGKRSPQTEDVAFRHTASCLNKVAKRKSASRVEELVMLTVFHELDLSHVQRVSKQYRELFLLQHGLELGLIGFFVRAVALAVRAFPSVNAFFDGKELVVHDECHVAVSAFTEHGTLAPVIYNAHTMGYIAIEKEIARLTVRAREGSISRDELCGATFEISDARGSSVLFSTPLVSSPRVATLALFDAFERPVLDGSLAMRPFMYLALSYDARALENLEAARFLSKVKEFVQDPAYLLLEA